MDYNFEELEKIMKVQIHLTIQDKETKEGGKRRDDRDRHDDRRDRDR